MVVCVCVRVSASYRITCDSYNYLIALHGITGHCFANSIEIEVTIVRAFFLKKKKKKKKHFLMRPLSESNIVVRLL